MTRLANVAALLALAGLSGCLEEQRYAVERERVYMPPDSEPAFFDDDDNPFFVEEKVFRLQIRPPSEQSLQTLTQSAQGMKLPFPRLPWVQREDEELRVDYTLENRSDQPVNAMVFVDGIDEFFEYTPGPEDFHQYERRLLVEAHKTVGGTITELEMDEIAIDLATAVNGAPNTALVVQFQGQSGRDPRVQKYIPKVVPGLVAFHMGIMSGGLGGGETAPDLKLTLSVRVQDHGDRIAARGEKHWDPLPTPTPFVPVVPEEDP
ncbi:MAG: hypothetical protein QM778_12985 [Myxococcales bacterium]